MADPNDLKTCERKGCNELAVGFNDDGEHLCEDCLFDDTMGNPEWEDEHNLNKTLAEGAERFLDDMAK